MCTYGKEACRILTMTAMRKVCYSLMCIMYACMHEMCTYGKEACRILTMTAMRKVYYSLMCIMYACMHVCMKCAHTERRRAGY